MINHYRNEFSNSEEEIEGVPTKDPAFGLPAMWINDRERERQNR